MRLKIAVSLTACALVAALSPALAGAADTPAPPTIGAVFSQTGPAAVYGQQQVKGAQLAVDDLNATAGFPGLLALQLRDDASTGETAKAAFTSLIDGGAVALLGPTLSGAAFIADPLAQLRGTPVLGISNTADGITEMGDNIFRNSLAERVVQPQTVKVAKRRLKLRRVAIVWATPDAYSKASNTVFRRALRANGVRVTTDRPFASDSPAALGRALDAAAKTRPDALVISALQGDVVKAMVGARKRRALKRVPFIGGNAFNAPGLYEQTKGAAEGAISGTAWVAGRKTPGSAAFEAAYRARYGTAPDQFAAQAYAGVRLLYTALTRSGGAGGAPLRDALAGLRKVPSILGTFSFDAAREPQYPAAVVQIRKGRPVTIG